MFVTKDTIIAEILQNDPTQGCVPIFLATGMHCLGCMAAHGETLEQACAVHGVDADALAAELKRMAKPGDVLLFKGSRGMRMELILDAFLSDDTEETLQ